MKNTEFKFKFKVNDGTELFAYEWRPKSNLPLGVILLVHGLGEHGGRYADWAHKFTQAGFAFMTFDQRGHGNSPGRRGHASSCDILLDDIECFRKESLKRWPNLPAFLYGHSLGGNLVLNYVLRRRPKFAGVIVTSPWLRLAVEPPAFIKALARFLSILWPTFSISSGLKSNDLTHDPSVVKTYQVDTLVHKKISVSLFTAIDQAGRWAMENAGQFNLPLLLMHGGGDRITSPEASKEFAGCVTKECSLKTWPGLFHELHNELEKDVIFAYTINWLNQVPAED